MTWASTSLGRSVSRTGLFLKKQIWIWPIIAVVLLAATGFGTRLAIESTMRSHLQSQLQTVLALETAMLENWIHVQESHAESEANDRHVREGIYRLLEEIETTPPTAATLKASMVQAELRKELGPAMSSYDYVSYFVADKSRTIIASSNDEILGQQDLTEYEVFLSRALSGTTTVSPPFPSRISMKDDQGRLRSGVPTMFVCAPVRDASFQVVAALAFRIRPEKEFTRILQLGQMGASGETYAFDKSGLLVSNSRFDDDLILLGLLPDTENSRSILNLTLRDPQGNVLKGHRPKVRRAELPLTRMALDATAGNSGVDVDGYRDYRGVPVVGAWTWLPRANMGVATELDYDEAFRPLFILRTTFFGLIGLLAVSSIAIFFFTIRVARLQREAQKAAIEARQLGQYTLENKLGEGGMGVVYKGRHAMLRRETAIKLLDVDKVNDASIQRFEREVQITCQLNHPNTVAIYDYGRTPEGVFYYAMEFLDGINLQALVERYGPQPEGRVIRILQQICGSLFEAHTHGLVHRDIKPANIMLNRRGGEPDVVKVLDFGLVKAVDEEKQASLTGAHSMTGTPLYMSPEAIQTPGGVDSRSDLYAVGAVGYFLLTGRPIFNATSFVELCQRHVADTPTLPNVLLGKPVSSELENAVMACLEKSRAKRPQTARDLSQMISRSSAATAWTIEEADAWWGRHERNRGLPAGESMASSITGTARNDRTFIGDINDEEMM